MWPNNFQTIRQSHDSMILPDLDCWTPVYAGPKLMTIPSQRGELYAYCPWAMDKYQIEPRFVPAMKFLNFDSGTVMLYVKHPL